MLFKTFSAAVFGIDAYLVGVEVDISAGNANFMTVGLPDAAVIVPSICPVGVRTKSRVR